MESFIKIINACYERGYSDLHMTGNHPLVCRRDGEVILQKQHIQTPQYMEGLVGRLLNPRQRQQLREQWSADLAVTVDDKRLRLNVFSTHRGVSMAIRFLPAVIPDVESLNLNPSLKEFCRARSGLLVICGSTGSGKTTTIAALVNEINNSRAGHVITLEDPIEYLFHSNTSFIEQRELGKHFHSFQQGLLDVLRQAPDVIVVGELRSADTIQLSLDAAESGQLVIATMHAGTHEEALLRLSSASQMSSGAHVRLQLSSCLVGVINQQLVYMPKLKHSVPLLSIMRNTKAVSNIIREGKFSQIEHFMETCKDKGMFTFKAYREDYLSKRSQFSPPPGRGGAKNAVGGPLEHASSLFNYNARGNSPGDQRPEAAGHSGLDRDGMPEDGVYGIGPEGIDDYIAKLEQRQDGGS